MACFSCSKNENKLSSKHHETPVQSKALNANAQGNAANIAEGDFNFYSSRQGDDQVRLMWQPVVWKRHWRAFLVKKRKNSKDKWVDLARGVMPLQSTLPASWDKFDTDKAEREKLQKYITAEIREGRLTPYSNDEFVKDIVKNPKLLNVIWMEALSNHYFARFLGLSCVDRQVKPSEKYEYGLFGIDLNGQESLLKTTILQSKKTGLPRDKVFINFVNKPTKLFIKCEISEKVCKQFSIGGLRFLRSLKGKDKFTPIVKNILRRTRPFGGFHFWGCSDRDVQDKVEYDYKVIVEDLFGNVLISAIQSRIYKSELEPPYFPSPPVFIHVDQTSKKNVEFSWTFKDDDLKNITAFYIEEYIGSKFQRITPKHKPADVLLDEKSRKKKFPFQKKTGDYSRGFGIKLDLDLVHDSLRSFRICALDLREQVRVGTFRSPLKINHHKYPEPPTGLKTKLILKKDNRHLSIAIEWDKVKLPEHIKGYRLKVGPREKLWWANKGKTITENTWTSHLPTNVLNRVYEAHLQFITKDGVRSKAIISRIFCPNTTFRSVNLRRYYENEDGSITWAWEYDKKIANLKGFRIYRDGILMADEKELTTDVRRWTTDEFELGVKHLYQIQAIGALSITTELGRITKTYTKK